VLVFADLAYDGPELLDTVTQDEASVSGSSLVQQQNCGSHGDDIKQCADKADKPATVRPGN